MYLFGFKCCVIISPGLNYPGIVSVLYNNLSYLLLYCFDMLSRIVLIIDDEPDSCLLWKSFLTQLNFKVYTALTLAHGLELVDAVRPNVIFLDNNLPDGLGWEKVDIIKKKIPECKINLVSAYDFDPKKWVSDNVRVMQKPITLSTIRSLLV